MGENDGNRLTAAEADLKKAIEKAGAELTRLVARRDTLKQTIEVLKKNLARLEAKGPRVVALVEYKRLRLEVLQSYKTLATVELSIRNITKNLKSLCRDRNSTQEQLRKFRRPHLA